MTKPNFDRPHFVDEATEVVYVAAGSWGEPIHPCDWVNKYFPHYKCVLITQGKLQSMINNDADV